MASAKMGCLVACLPGKTAMLQFSLRLLCRAVYYRGEDGQHDAVGLAAGKEKGIMHMVYRLPWVVLLLALVGCARPQLLGTWVNPHETVKPVSKIMVVGVSKDQIARNLYEDHLLDKLWELGTIQAKPSYKVVPVKTGAYPDQQQLQQAVQSSEVEAVLTSMVLWVKRDAALAFVQPKPGGEAGWRGWSGFYGRVFYEPPQSRVSDTVIVESSLYDVQRDTLLWSGSVAIGTERMSETEGIAGLTGMLVQNLLARRLLRTTAQ